MNLQDAYAECEAITRREAKNFAYGIRLLHPPERRALSAVYALARRIDDIGDGDAPGGRAPRRAWPRCARTSTPSTPTTDDPVLVAVADAAARYGLPDGRLRRADRRLRDGRGRHRLRDHRRPGRLLPPGGRLDRPAVAGRLRGSDPARAVPLADDLGVALQLTNILRDVVEDRGNGRVYLPADDAARGRLPARPDRAARRRWPPWSPSSAPGPRSGSTAGLGLLPLLDRRSRACVGAMAGIYRRLLGRIERDPLAVTRGRVSLPTSGEGAGGRPRAWPGSRP